MDRKSFLKLLAAMPFAPYGMKLNDLKNIADTFETTEKMPVLFIGHGNPMNTIEKNEFHNAWVDLGKNLPKPKAILCISAHWLTKGTKVTAMEAPKTIHDFGGFPAELFAQQYPAKGAVYFAEETKKIITTTSVESDMEWGLDHGTWSVLLPMYPKADIPVFQLSLDYTKPPEYHYNLAKELSVLRKKGVLIIGSGNIVHNLRKVVFSEQAYGWAVEFDGKIKSLILSKEHKPIINYQELGNAAKLSVPTNDHYLPLLYSLALQDSQDDIRFFNEKNVMGAISMRSVILGKS
jgi:4,5-DOPA dioxygenase extradiol